MMRKPVVGIFEDDSVDRFIYERLFERLKDHVEVHIFDNLQKGYDFVKKCALDVVVIEAHFQGDFGGVSILRTLKEISRHPMVFIATASLLQQGDQEHFTTSGFHKCLEKSTAFTKLNIDNLSKCRHFNEPYALPACSN